MKVTSILPPPYFLLASFIVCFISLLCFWISEISMGSSLCLWVLCWDVLSFICFRHASWNTFMMATLQCFSCNSNNSANSILLSVYCLFSLKLWCSRLLLWSIIFCWNIDNLGIILWDSKSYLKFVSFQDSANVRGGNSGSLWGSLLLLSGDGSAGFSLLLLLLLSHFSHVWLCATP